MIDIVDIKKDLSKGRIKKYKWEQKNPKVAFAIGFTSSTFTDEDGFLQGTSSILPLDWTQKRTEFAAAFNENTNGFYFNHPGGKHVEIKAFIAKVEDILELSEKQGQSILPFGVGLRHLIYAPTFVIPTSEKDISWIVPSNFWLSCPIRRSLFTILLQCGQNYDMANFERALYSNKYVKNTRKAIQRFLFGFTTFNQDLNEKKKDKPKKEKEKKKDDEDKVIVKIPGWLSTFKGKNLDYVRRTLVSQDQRGGLGCIWS